MPRANHLARSTFLLAVAAGAAAFAPSQPGSLAPLVRRIAYLPPEAPATLESERARDDAAAALGAEADGPWEVALDPATLGLRRALGTGIALVDAEAWEAMGTDGQELTLDQVEVLARAFLGRHPAIFPTDLAEWSIARESSRRIDRGRLWPVRFERSIGGVPAEHAQIQLVLNRGKLTYLNATGLDPIAIAAVPTLDEARTWSAVEREAARAGISLAGAEPIGRVTMAIVPERAAPADPIRHRLVRRHTFRLPDGLETWRAGVDAHSGELVELEDANRYACSLDPTFLQGQVRGGVKPARATDVERNWNFPFAALLDAGADTASDYNGYFSYSGGQANSILNGSYFNVNCNGCTPNPPAQGTIAGNGLIDFGIGGTDQNSNGASTPADRTSFYHLNVARAMAAKWVELPWIRANVRDNINIPASCNAFWDGSSVNFFRSSAQCWNTGEIRDVMQHEWGHGLDSNDGLNPRDSAMGEAYGDYIALFVDHDSCIGQSFFKSSAQNSGNYCEQVPQCLTQQPCTGVRNIDEKKTTSGLLAVSNVVQVCGGGGCAGPLGAECHCEGEVFGQAAFHLTMNLLTGTDYATNLALPGANPAYSSIAAWNIHERIFFNAAQLMVSYLPSNRQGLGTGAYDAFITVDDDDANPNNGTPNAAYINAAFSHHGIQEPTMAADSVNCTAPADPTVTVQPLYDETTGFAQVKVSWTDSNALFYDVYRTLKPTDVWLPVRQQINDDNRAAYEIYDEPIQVGETYYYVVVAVSPSGCASPGSNMRTIVVDLPDAAVAIGTVSDAAPGGDGDGVIEPGELVSLRLDLRELLGRVPISNASVELLSLDPLAQITQGGPIVYGTVPAGQTVNGPSQFQVGIALDHGCNSQVPLIAAVTADNACMLRPVALTVGGAGCAPANRGEASPSGLAVLRSNLDPACTDNDLFLDNGETGEIQVTVRNPGTATARNITVLLRPQTPEVSVIGTNPVSIATLAGGQSTSVTFQVTATGAACKAEAMLEAEVDSDDNFFPIRKTWTIPLEEDRTAINLDTGFESDFGRWSATGFTRETFRKNSGTYSMYGGPAPGTACDGTTGNGGGDCETLTSPPFVPAATSTFTLYNWYLLEAFDGTQYWDRANVHVVDRTGRHTLISPVAGKLYVGSAGDSSNFCHVEDQDSWAGDAGNAWGSSTFDLGPYSGQEIRLEINYNADSLAICEGVYFDDLTVTGAQERLCDALSCVPVSQPRIEVTVCADSSRCGSTGQADGTIDPGEDVTYQITLRNTGTGDAVDVRGDVVATGGNVLSGGAIGGTPVITLRPDATYVHTAVIAATGACGSALDIDVINLRAGTSTFSPSLTMCDREIGASDPGGIQTLRDVAQAPIPETPNPGIARRLYNPVGTTLARATLAIQVMHSRPSELTALLVGPRGSRDLVNPAINGTFDVTALVNADGAGDYVLDLRDDERGRSGTLLEWSLTLDVEPFSACEPCAGTCLAPSITVLPSSTTICAGGNAAFTATFPTPGAGAFDYEWDFGDGTIVPVTDPFATAVHRFPGAQSSYDVVFRATSLSSPSCSAERRATVTIDPGSVPAGGPIRNRLRARRQGLGARFEWTGSGVNPPRFVLHKTFDRLELGDNPAGIGDEAAIARTIAEWALDPGALAAQPPLAFYEVYAADSCGGTVFP